MPSSTVTFEDGLIAPAAEHTLESQAVHILEPASKDAVFSLFQTPRVSIILTVLAVLILLRIAGGSRSKKLPPGVKRLPRLPG